MFEPQMEHRSNTDLRKSACDFLRHISCLCLFSICVSSVFHLWLLSFVAAADEPQSVVINSLDMKFVHIPKGKFLMGSPATEEQRGDDEWQHQVALTKDFYLGVHEVTQGQYERVMGNNPSCFTPTGAGKAKV